MASFRPGQGSKTDVALAAGGTDLRNVLNQRLGLRRRLACSRPERPGEGGHAHAESLRDLLQFLSLTPQVPGCRKFRRRSSPADVRRVVPWLSRPLTLPSCVRTIGSVRTLPETGTCRRSASRARWSCPARVSAHDSLTGQLHPGVSQPQCRVSPGFCDAVAGTAIARLPAATAITALVRSIVLRHFGDSLERGWN